MKQFNLPDVGEGLQEAEIVQWNVQVGDLVEADQIILIIETDKANVEIPSPYKGKITRLHGNPGDIVKVGNPLVEFDGEEEAVAEVSAEDAGTVVGKLETGAEMLENYSSGNQTTAVTKKKIIRATPAVRALATRLEVDINGIEGSGPRGTVTKTDVEYAATNGLSPAKYLEKTNVQLQETTPKTPAFDGQPLKRAKRSMALNMAKSHAEVAQVTLSDDADISHWGKKEDLTARMVRAIVAACKTEPALNVYYDHDSLSIKTFDQVHLGIAVDTPEGLYVPVLKNAEQVKPQQIRETINQFKAKAKEKSFLQDELKGATLILSNFGGIGGRYATPMVVPPMVCILGVGRSHTALDLVDDKPKQLKKLPLSLSFDHRAVTGGEGARFLETVIKDLQSD